MTEPQHIKPILKALRDELALQTRHLKLLESQQLALLACDRARFAALQEDYALVLVQLEAQDTARRAALTGDDGEPLTLAALKDQCGERSRAVLQGLEDSLRRTLDSVQLLTKRNQTLIQNELDYLAFSLDLFVEAGRSADNGYGTNPIRSRAGRAASLLLLDRRA